MEIDGQLLITATAAAGLAKTAVDVIKSQTTLPPIVPPLAAFLISMLIMFCMYGAAGQIGDRTVYTVILGGFVALPLAIGATAVQAYTERRATDNRIVEIIDRAETDKIRAVEASTAATARAVANATQQPMQAVRPISEH